MAEDNNNTAAESPQAQKMGCGAWLGLFLLTVIVLSVVFFLLIKPRLEARGVDVDEKIENVMKQLWDWGGQTSGTVQQLASESEKAAAETKEKIAETTEKAKEISEEVKEAASDAAEKNREKTRETVDKVKETAEEVESWY